MFLHRCRNLMTLPLQSLIKPPAPLVDKAFTYIMSLHMKKMEDE